MRLRSRLRRSQVAQAVDATDFRPSRNSGGGVPVAAHSLQECRRAIARRRRQFAHLEFLDPLCGMVQVCRPNVWREDQPEMWRPGPAHRYRPTQESMCKRGAHCGAESRTLAFLHPLCVAWRKCMVGQCVAGEPRGGVAMQTSAPVPTTRENMCSLRW